MRKNRNGSAAAARSGFLRDWHASICGDLADTFEIAPIYSVNIVNQMPQTLF
jgi:hypothetical protein